MRDPNSPRHISDGASDAFPDRLRLMIGSESGVSFSKRCGFSEGTLRSYLSGADPSRARLVAMADAANVNIAWLAAGRGPMKGAAETAEPINDLELLAQTVAAVEKGLRAIDRTLPPAKYGELVAAAYALMKTPGTASAQVVQFIKAAA